MPTYLSKVLTDLLKLGLSFGLAFPIGLDRELEDRGAGVRTLPLVSLGSCALLLVASSAWNGATDSLAKVLQGLITGIGFVGGGAILKSHTSVHGTATAASIWNMSVIGAAVAFGIYDIAIILAVINYLALRLLRPLKREVDKLPN